MSHGHWYQRLHWRAVVLFFLTLILVNTVIWIWLGVRFPDEIRSVRRGLAAGVFGGALAGLAVAYYIRRLVLSRLDRARHRVQNSLKGAALDFRQDEVDLGAEDLIEGISALRAEVESLQAQTNRLSVLLDGMNESVIMTDERERLLIMNSVAERVLGLDGTSIGKRLVEVTEFPEVSNIVAEVLWNNEAVVREIEDVLEANDVRHYTVSAAPIVDDSGGSSGSVLVLYDITRLRRLEQVRRDFVANVSHELRTPIATIRSVSETLLMDEVNLDPVSSDFVETIFRNSGRMTRIVEDLLTLSKLEASGEDFKPELVDVSLEVSDVLDEYREPAAKRGVRFDVALEDLRCQVLGDSFALRQIVQNLVENAIKYTPDGGTISITGRRENGRCLISVKDTGVGIPESHVPRVFERFYRVDAGRSRDVGGTGLGLSIVKHLVRRLGGDIEVSSEVGVGSTFTFWIPMGEEEEQDG